MNSIRPDQVSNRFIDENLQAEDALASGNVAEAAKILLSITEKDPQNWRAFNNMGILSWSRKSWQDAFAMFKKAVLLSPDYEDALINLFDAGLKLKRVQEIQPLFDLALKMNTDLADVKAINDSILSLKDEIYQSKRALCIGFYSPIIEEAEKELEAGNYHSAMEKFLKANDTEGPSAAAFSGLGIISFYQKHFQDAFTLFIESIKLNPSDPDIYLNLLDASKEIGKENTAKEIYDLYRAEFPELESIAKNFEFRD
jgi:tetratricopeptide (TPR) repeat protein